MADTTPIPAAPEVLIYDSHIPALTDGYYKIRVSQTFKVAVPGAANDKPYTVTAPDFDFEVAGEQYAIDPQQVDSVFPPANANGDFTGILPNIILNRSTLPWEREIFLTDTGSKDPIPQTGPPPVKPWMALLLFTEDELVDASKLATLDPVKFNTMTVTQENWEAGKFGRIATGDKNKPTLSGLFIDSSIKDGLLNSILPFSTTASSGSFVEASYLAHVRGKAGGEKAVIVGSRMPVKNKRNIVHLVSLEENYYASGVFAGKTLVNNDADNAADKAKQYYGFASLQSWEFFCTDHFIVTPEVVATYTDITNSGIKIKEALAAILNTEYYDESDFINAINANIPSGATIPNNAAVADSAATVAVKNALFAAFEVAHLNQILTHLNLNSSHAGMRLSATDGLSAQGYIKLPYKLRTGNTINSIYRGPLMPGNVTGKAVADFFAKPLPRTGDDMLQFLNAADKAVVDSSYLPAVDISYASAWELGRLLALRDKNFSIALFQWKRTCYQTYKSLANGATYAAPPMPAFVRTWFDDMLLLKYVPFNYLVPSEDYLPFESIRFFVVDQYWLQCLVDGAFSIARISANDAMIDAQLYQQQSPFKSSLSAPVVGNALSGFLLRSRAVSGWPHLVIEGSNKTGNSNLFQTNLSPNLLLCLFDNVITNLCLYQKPESVHFGFEQDNNDDNLHVLYTSPPADDSAAAPVIQEVAVALHANNKVDIAGLYAKLDTAYTKDNGSPAFCTASFTALLVQDIEKINFSIA